MDPLLALNSKENYLICMDSLKSEVKRLYSTWISFNLDYCLIRKRKISLEEAESSSKGSSEQVYG